MNGLALNAFSLITKALLSLILLTASLAFAEPIHIVYPQFVSNEYFFEVLELALSKSGVDYQLKPNNQHMTQSRKIAQLESGDGIDVVWTMTTPEREKGALPIRIPIEKGLMGWRIFFINKRDHDAFATIHSLQQLQSQTAGQGHDWPDAQILRANGLNVVAGTSFGGLFKMLQADRFQYFPRSIMEAWVEEKAHVDEGLEVEQTLALHYPSAVYFFVNKRNIALANVIERGLRAAIKDGSFDNLFNRYYGEIIRRTDLKGRTVLELSNPMMLDETLLQQQELWFRP